MKEVALEGFRSIADTMIGAPQTWQFIGRWESQRYFGITQERAEALAARFPDGVASPMGGR